MQKKKFVFTLAVALLVTSGIGYAVYSKFYGNLDNRHATCLAAIVPSVVLHYQQEEIVQLLQDLAKETQEAAAPELTSPTPALFSSRVDQELLKIASAFQNQPAGQDVAQPMSAAMKYLAEDAPDFLSSCLTLVSEAQDLCGTLEAETPHEKTCLDPYSEKINALVNLVAKK